MTDPCALSDAALLEERAKWENRLEALERRLFEEICHPIAIWEWLDGREAASYAEDRLEAAEAEIARRERDR